MMLAVAAVGLDEQLTDDESGGVLFFRHITDITSQLLKLVYHFIDLLIREYFFPS